MKYYNRIILLCLSLGVFAACEDDGEYDHPLIKPAVPETAVMFPGATTFGANPYYTVSLANGNISIQVSVSEGSAMQIKEITKMIAGATGITPGNVANAATPNYLAGPITVSGGTATITTTITEFNSKVAAGARVTAASIPAGGFAERAFMFIVTLEDNTTVIPQQVRMRVIP